MLFFHPYDFYYYLHFKRRKSAQTEPAIGGLDMTEAVRQNRNRSTVAGMSGA